MTRDWKDDPTKVLELARWAQDEGLVSDGLDVVEKPHRYEDLYQQMHLERLADRRRAA